MDNNENKKKIEAILEKYEGNIQKVYVCITKDEGNVTLKKSERKMKMKDLILKEVTKNVN